MKRIFLMLVVVVFLMAPMSADAQSAKKSSTSRTTTAQLVKQAEAKAVEGEYLEAAKIYKRIVNRGSKVYSYNVAQMYQRRLYSDCYGISADVIQGWVNELMSWLTKAAVDGNVDAQFELGKMYLGILGVEQDEEKALKWLEEASENGNIEASYELGEIYYGEEPLLHHYDKPKAMEYYRRGAEKSHLNSMQKLADILFFWGSKEEACKWYLKAAELGDAESAYRIGLNYYNGDGVPKNSILGKKWVLKAAEMNHSGAQYVIGVNYLHDGSYGQNNQKGLEWLSKASKNGNMEALFELGKFRFYGWYGLPQDKQLGLKGIRLAAERGYDDAKTWLKENGYR